MLWGVVLTTIATPCFVVAMTISKTLAIRVSVLMADRLKHTTFLSKFNTYFRVE